MRYLKQSEMDQIKKLRMEGARVKDIAKQFNVSEGTISNIVNGKNIPRKFKEVVGSYIRSPYDPIEFKEEVFKDLPDEVLFQPVRDRDFIG